MFGFEFTVTGIPLSLQCRNKESLNRWKTEVYNAALLKWTPGLPPFKGDLTIKITYYFDNDSPDVDNIIKPIQDALKGLVYGDDHQIVKTQCEKKDINGSYKIRRAPPIIIAGFLNGDDFLHIKIEEPESVNRQVLQ
jgi:Holliday junction resolvase RusA-like endonuclease